MIILCHGKFEDLTPSDLTRLAVQVGSGLGMFSLVVADPPDNIGLAYDGHHDRMAPSQYSKLMEEWMIRACMISMGPVFWTFNEKWTGLVEDILARNPRHVPLIQRCYWRWSFGVNQAHRYVPCVRPVYWLKDGTALMEHIRVPSYRETHGDKRAKKGGKTPDNLWEFNRVAGTHAERRKWHRTQLPEAMVRRMLRGHALTGDAVLDPFIGSGTTAYAGLDLGYNVVGIDQSKNYLRKIRQELLIRARGLGLPKPEIKMEG